MKEYDGDQLLNDPRLVELCLNCKRYKCHGICDDYIHLRREISPFTRKAKFVGKLWEMDGREMTISQWAIEYRMNYATLRRLVSRGMTVKEAIQYYYEKGDETDGR